MSSQDVIDVLGNMGQKTRILNMFNEIQNINWADLKQAHGNSVHVPEAIKGLISNDEKEQEASYWKLDNHVVLQGDLYQAAFYVIPFLLEILVSKIKFGRNYVYDLLFEIANGFAAEEATCVYDGVALSLTDACKTAVLGGVDLYLEEVTDTSSLCRENALDLLISLEVGSDKVITRLNAIKDQEADLDFRLKLEEAISEISG